MKLDNLMALFLAVFGVSACGTYAPYTLETGEAAAARLQSQRVEAAALLDFATAPVQAEPRNAAWANAQEADLRVAFSQTGSLENASLTQTECRASGCLIEIELPADNDPAVYLARRQAATDWIAWSQPCAFTMVSEDATANTLMIVTQCEND